MAKANSTTTNMGTVFILPIITFGQTSIQKLKIVRSMLSTEHVALIYLEMKRIDGLLA